MQSMELSQKIQKSRTKRGWKSGTGGVVEQIVMEGGEIRVFCEYVRVAFKHDEEFCATQLNNQILTQHLCTAIPTAHQWLVQKNFNHHSDIDIAHRIRVNVLEPR